MLQLRIRHPPDRIAELNAVDPLASGFLKVAGVTNHSDRVGVESCAERRFRD